MQRREPDGNVNNVYQFHERTKYENFRVIASYKTNSKLDSHNLSVEGQNREHGEHK